MLNAEQTELSRKVPAGLNSLGKHIGCVGWHTGWFSEVWMRFETSRAGALLSMQIIHMHFRHKSSLIDGRE